MTAAYKYFFLTSFFNIFLGFKKKKIELTWVSAKMASNDKSIFMVNSQLNNKHFEY